MSWSLPEFSQFYMEASSKSIGLTVASVPERNYIVVDVTMAPPKAYSVNFSFCCDTRPRRRTSLVPLEHPLSHCPTWTPTYSFTIIMYLFINATPTASAKYECNIPC